MQLSPGGHIGIFRKVTADMRFQFWQISVQDEFKPILIISKLVLFTKSESIIPNNNINKL